VAVARWLATEFPAIRALAKWEGGWCCGWMSWGIRSPAAAGRSWAPVGQTPVIKETGKRCRVNMLSAVSHAGRLRFRLVVGSCSGAVFIDFLGRLLRDCGGRKGPPDRGWSSRAPGQGGQRRVGRHGDRIELRGPAAAALGG
jgi:hypothetical protein